MTFFEKQTDPTSPMHWRGDMQADYLYPSGVAGDKFFKHIKENDSFLASKCSKCNKVFFPPRMYCEDCFCEISDRDWFEVPASGTVELFTVAKIDTYGEKFEKPRVIGFINIDTTDGALIGIIETDILDENLFGKKVEAVFKPKNMREGTLKDILFFKKK